MYMLPLVNVKEICYKQRDDGLYDVFITVPFADKDNIDDIHMCEFSLVVEELPKLEAIPQEDEILYTIKIIE